MKKWSIRLLLGLLVLGLVFEAWVFGSMLRPGAGPSTAVDPNGKTIQIAGGSLPPGCRCHSNKPAVIAAHKKYGIKDCAKCHPNDLPTDDSDSSNIPQSALP